MKCYDRQHEQSIEDLIQAKGLTAPRITPEDLDNAISTQVPVQYRVFPDNNTTACLVTLKNGFTITRILLCRPGEL